MTLYIDTQDKRNLVVKNLLENNYEVKIFEDFNIFPNSTVIFAPNKKFSNDEINNMPNNISIVCGNLLENQKKMLKNKKILHYNVLTDEVYAIKNSNLTAEGILELIISQTEKSIFEQKYLILGSGRVGKTLANLFNKLSLDFSMTSNDENNFSLDYIYTNNNYFGEDYKKDLSQFDVIINSIPATTLSEKDLRLIKKDALFLEISSLQTITQETQFKYLLCPALPQRFSALTAGKYLYDCIIKMLKLTS